jgi:hypothetical protein
VALKFLPCHSIVVIDVVVVVFVVVVFVVCVGGCVGVFVYDEIYFYSA